MTWTPTSSPTRRAAAAPASVAAFTEPTSPRTIAVTRPASTFCQPTKTTLAALTIASAASTMPTRPRVSIMPSASPISRFSLLSGIWLFDSPHRLLDSTSRRDRDGVDDSIAVDQPHRIDQVRNDARVVRDDADAVARFERGRAGDTHGGVLLGQPFDRQRLVGMPRRVAVAGQHRAEPGRRQDAARLIVGERLAAAV